MEDPTRLMEAYLASAQAQEQWAQARLVVTEPICRMKIIFKLYASLTDYLPAEARYDNRVQLELPDGATIAAGHRALRPAAEAGAPGARQRRLRARPRSA